MTPKNNNSHPFQCTHFIIKGPSRLDLMLALFDSYPGLTPNGRILRFVTKTSLVFKEYPEISVEFCISGAERDDADYEKWTLWGKATAEGEEGDVRILYRTDLRQGKIIKA